MIIQDVRGQRITKADLVKELGLKVVDYALPQKWLDQVVDKIKAKSLSENVHLNPEITIYDAILSGTVWCYDPYPDGKHPLMGIYWPMTVYSVDLLRFAGLNVSHIEKVYRTL